MLGPLERLGMWMAEEDEADAVGENVNGENVGGDEDTRPSARKILGDGTDGAVTTFRTVTNGDETTTGNSPMETK